MTTHAVTKLVPPVNVDERERWISVLAGAGLIALGLGRTRMKGVFLTVGGALVLRGITGRSAVNQLLGRDHWLDDDEPEFDSPVASVHRGEGLRVDRSVIIDRPTDELYRYWRNFENLPFILKHVEAVNLLDDYRSHWVVKGPAGKRFEWYAEIHNEKENELIAWRTVGGEVKHAGTVLFTPAPGGRGTEVKVELRYEPPAGIVGATLAKLLGHDPADQVEEDLRRFKQVMEMPDVLSRSASVPAGPGG
jgi:uncharacterized membrane protein